MNVPVLTQEGIEADDILATRWTEGAAIEDIAAELVLSNAAVAKHVSNIFTKLRLDPSEDNRRVKAILQYLSAATYGG